MNKSQTPYELRAMLLNQAVNIVTRQNDVAYQIAESNFHLVSGYMKDVGDLGMKDFKEAKEELEKAQSLYQKTLTDALVLAEAMNAFVSKNN